MIDFDNYTDCKQCESKCIVRFIENTEIPLLNQNKSEIYYSPGQVITKQFSFSSKIVYLSNGLVKILKEGKNGKNTMIKVAGENSFISFPLKENQKKYPFTAIALTEVKICEINEAAVHHLISENQDLKDFLVESYFEEQLYLMNRIHLLNTRNNHGKLALSLVYLNSFNKPDFSIFDLITRKDLAELSSISLESVNKILQELKNDRIIEITNKGIQISKLNLIEKLSSIG
jgi:CRP/FNR family transcriptional regulator